ncbi:unnamed protein product [Soboliphyme baturini]|uniref:ShKT domain-containing protein n=1 Tax=Soboliphyme baturini TaxID=241478 RepID=A0A183II03_9BILA|nr:unnamed protein product [Soboliphyme baturini]
MMGECYRSTVLMTILCQEVCGTCDCKADDLWACQPKVNFLNCARKWKASRCKNKGSTISPNILPTLQSVTLRPPRGSDEIFDFNIKATQMKEGKILSMKPLKPMPSTMVPPGRAENVSTSMEKDKRVVKPSPYRESNVTITFVSPDVFQNLQPRESSEPEEEHRRGINRGRVVLKERMSNASDNDDMANKSGSFASNETHMLVPIGSGQLAVPGHPSSLERIKNGASFSREEELIDMTHREDSRKEPASEVASSTGNKGGFSDEYLEFSGDILMEMENNTHEGSIDGRVQTVSLDSESTTSKTPELVASTTYSTSSTQSANQSQIQTSQSSSVEKVGSKQVQKNGPDKNGTGRNTDSGSAHSPSDAGSSESIGSVSQPTVGKECSDVDSACEYWASIGECEKNRFWMKTNCQKSCNSCGLSLADVEPIRQRDGKKISTENTQYLV